MVDDIEHIESWSLNGVAVIKVCFQLHAVLEKAIARITAISQTQLRQLSEGVTPPLGATVPYAYGSKQRQVQMDLNPALFQAKGLSPTDDDGGRDLSTQKLTGMQISGLAIT
jgi:multidrug efflux pump subunit AcrB